MGSGTQSEVLAFDRNRNRFFSVTEGRQSATTGTGWWVYTGVGRMGNDCQIFSFFYHSIIEFIKTKYMPNIMYQVHKGSELYSL